MRTVCEGGARWECENVGVRTVCECVCECMCVCVLCVRGVLGGSVRVWVCR